MKNGFSSFHQLSYIKSKYYIIEFMKIVMKDYAKQLARKSVLDFKKYIDENLNKE